MVEHKRIVATIEARMTSSRLPGKVLMEACGKPMLQHMIERLQRVPSLDGIIVATTGNDTDAAIVELAESMGVGFFRGSEAFELDSNCQALPPLCKKKAKMTHYRLFAQGSCRTCSQHWQSQVLLFFFADEWLTCVLG